MRNSGRLAIIAVLTLSVVFAGIVIRSILLRSETTNHYPDYSSLNNRASGTKAYFDALERLGFITSRNFKPLKKLSGSHADVFYAGLELWAFQFSDPNDLREYEQLASSGARLIIALDPEGAIELSSENAKKKANAEARKDNLKKRWGIELMHVDRPVAAQTGRVLARLGLQPVNWQFSSWSKDWTPSHIRSGAPLFLERTFGKGSIVLVGQSKLFTNDELAVHPDNEALAAAPGVYRAIVFDESHLGVEDTGTVLALVIAHRLDWMLLGFGVLAILYIWRSSVSFVPPHDSPAETTIAGRDAHVALSNLLMQSVPARSILRICAEEWNRSAGIQARRPGRTLGEEDLGSLDGVAPDRAAAGYRALADRLNSRVTSGKPAPL